jgi:DNA-binding CsgD family transcriptional regulator
MKTIIGEQKSKLVPSSETEIVEGMVLVDLSRQPVAMDAGGEAILRELNEERAGGNSPMELPEELTEALNGAECAALNAPAMRMNGGESQFSCRIFLLQPQDDMMPEALFAVHMKRERSVAEAVRRVGKLYHLTVREQEALVGIAMGLTSRQLADRMSISPNTVNAFLRLIMVKMGVTTRAGLVGKLLNGKPVGQARTAEWRPDPLRR